MIRLLVLFAATLPIAAQNPLYIDLSGEWRLSRNDRPEFATVGVDDSGWERVRLPSPAVRFQRDPAWLRRTVDLPLGTDTAKLALTLGTIQDVFEVYVNGRRIGGSGDFESYEDAVIPRP